MTKRAPLASGATCRYLHSTVGRLYQIAKLRYNRPTMDVNDFDRFVDEALHDLPAVFRDRLDNLAIVVEDWPDRQTMRVAGVRRPDDLLGFYHGVPLTKRTQDYNMVTPDKISIYRSPILMHCRRTGEDVRAAVQHVLRHEVAHFFGIDDDRLEELGAY